MAIFFKKDFQPAIFYECNQALASQVTEVCDLKQAVFSAKIKENNTEFPDAVIYDTYSDIQDMFQGMYNANVEDEIYLGKKKGRLYLEDEIYCADLEAVMEDMRDYIKDLVYEFGSLANAGSGTVTVSDSFAAYLLRRNLSKEEYEEYEALTAKALKSDPVLSLTAEEKKRFIELYETVYPSDTDNMKSIVSIFENECYVGRKEDLMNIKVLVYTADEPYKSVYIKNISRVKKGDPNYTGYPYASNGAFYVNLAKGADKKTSVTYSEFFHETSHCIDYYLESETGFTVSYRDGDTGLSLQEVLEADVRTRIHNTVDDYFKANSGNTIMQQEIIRAHVEDAIMNQIDYPSYGNPNFTLIVGTGPFVDPEDVKNCYNYVINDIQKRVVGFAGDNYGGLTGNTLLNPECGRHGAIRKGNGKHRLYWISGMIEEDGSNLYITLENGERYGEIVDFTDEEQCKNSDLDERVIMSEADVVYKDSIVKEFFANSMAANLCRDSDDLKAYDFYYQETTDYFEKMLEAMY